MTLPRPFRLALVSMPWAIFHRPSIQLGALKSYLQEKTPAEVRTFHPYLEIGRLLGKDLYHFISGSVWISEALYSAILYPGLRPQLRALVAGELRRAGNHALPLDFDSTITRLENQLAAWVAGNDWQQFDLVGFSVCFNQLLATLAAVSALKQKYPSLSVVLGGSACHPDAASGLLRHFPVDFMISGEGEAALQSLCTFLAGQHDALDGRVYHSGFCGRQTPGGRQLDLAELPCPDYDDYFREMREVFRGEPFIPEVPIEFSRGCWWRKCAFCNLNLQWRGYRCKSADRMAAEVFTLAGRHKVLDFMFTDNALPPKEAGAFFDAMADCGRDFRFFAEIRADHRGKVMAASRRGGLTSVQVGIEALSQSLLVKMAKGVTVIENLAVMKDAVANDVVLDGNLIIEFPGSTREEVEETLVNLDFAFPFHPLAAAVFFLGHGSPVDTDPQRYGIRASRIHPSGSRLFPDAIGADLALLVKGYRGNRASQRRLWTPVRQKVQQWRDYHERRRRSERLLLSYRDGGDFLIIRQELPDNRILHHRLQGVSRLLYLACETTADLPSLAALFPGVSAGRLEKFLDDLVDKRLMFRENKRFLALAVRQKSG